MDATKYLIKLSVFLPNLRQLQYVKTPKTDSISVKSCKSHALLTGQDTTLCQLILVWFTRVLK